MVALIGWQKFFTQFLVRRYLHSIGSVSYQYFPFKVTLLDPSQGSDTVSFSAFSAEAGLESFDLFTQKDSAWLLDASQNDNLAGALRAGNQVIVEGATSTGIAVTETFSLSGATAASRAIDGC